MMEKRIDLNCDLGEWKTPNGAEKDKAIMPFISSCNVACGGHIGDEESMRATIQLAKRFGVSIGAHPAYPDPDNFGRVVMDISTRELEENLYNQINRFKKLVEEEGAALHHIKPHGALYNQAAKDEETAYAVVSVIQLIDKEISVYLPPNSVSGKIAREAGLRVISEVFADRAYEDDLSLRSRSLPDAILKDEVDVIAQLKSMIFSGKVSTQSGVQKAIQAETVCLHSDTPGAIKLAKSIHEFLTSHGIEVTTL